MLLHLARDRYGTVEEVNVPGTVPTTTTQENWVMTV